MSEALVLGIVRQAIETAVIISLPMLAVGLVVGVSVSIIQTVTSVQDSILSFVFALTFPWMLRVLTGFSAALIRRLPELVR